MKRAVQIAALVIAIATVSLWFATGASTGWTKNRVPVKTVDPITEIEQIEWQDKFVPGVDVLGGGLVVAAALFGGSLFIRKPNKQQQTR